MYGPTDRSVARQKEKFPYTMFIWGSLMLILIILFDKDHVLPKVRKMVMRY